MEDYPLRPLSESHQTAAPEPIGSRHQKFVSGALADPQGTPDDLDQLPDPLPMTLWLRGDESYCSQFSMDADAVMIQLGIKRTRLTQISGRELRVGRIKRGRYIVPVYRPEDIHEYLSWTRATATHLKATQAVQTATSDLRETASQIFTKMETTLSEVSEALAHDIITRVAAPLSKILAHDLKQLTEESLSRCLSQIDQLRQRVTFEAEKISVENTNHYFDYNDRLKKLEISHQSSLTTLLKTLNVLTSETLPQLIDLNAEKLGILLTSEIQQFKETLLNDQHFRDAQWKKFDEAINGMDKRLQEMNERIVGGDRTKNGKQTHSAPTKKAETRRIIKSDRLSNEKTSRPRRAPNSNKSKFRHNQ